MTSHIMIRHEQLSCPDTKNIDLFLNLCTRDMDLYMFNVIKTEQPLEH